MTRRQFVFDSPDRFITGTVGVPGQRTFYLQARYGERIVSVSLEKVQVAVLADRLGKLVDELERRGIASTSPADTDIAPLDEPLNEAFRATSLTLGWDPATGRFIIEARSVPEIDEEDEDASAPAATDDAASPFAFVAPADDEDDALLRVTLTPDATRSFVERAMRVLGSGRPPCPLCGQPLDATGHICPRGNGHYVN